MRGCLGAVIQLLDSYELDHLLPAHFPVIVLQVLSLMIAWLRFTWRLGERACSHQSPKREI